MREPHARVLALAALLAVIAAAAYWVKHPFPKPGESASAVLQSATSTPWHTDRIERSMVVEARPVADWVDSAEIVARVDVVAVGEPLFNTPSGAHPTEDPDGATHGLFVGSAVTFLVTEYYKGQESGYDGFVVRMWGGQKDAFAYDVYPSSVFEVGAAGIACLTPLPPDMPTEPYGHWIEHVRDEAEQLNNQGGSFAPAEVSCFFEFIDEEADIAGSVFEGVNMPISQLLLDIGAALD